MDLDTLHKSLHETYNKRYKTLEKRVSHCIDNIPNELNHDINELTLQEIKTVANTILDIETKKLHDEVEKLLAQKELLERKLERKSQALQESKYHIFDANRGKT